MAFLSVSEFQSITHANPSGFHAIPAPMSPAVVEQSVAIGGTTTTSAAFSNTTRFIQVNTDTVCVLAFNGGLPTQGIHRLGQNETRYYGVNAGGTISVMTSNT